MRPTYMVSNLVVQQPGVSQATTWQERAIEKKIVAYDPANPLGVDSIVKWLVYLFYPCLVVIAGLLNLFALWVLQSGFLRPLVVQPMMKTFLHLHNVLIAVGPLYVWLVHTFGMYLSRSKVYSCFILLWLHNFASLATSGVLVAMLVERALSLGKPEVLWKIWRRASRTICCLIFGASIFFAVAGLVFVDGETANKSSGYPLCLPWWDNENGSLNPSWYKIIALGFSLCPCILMILAMLLLLISVARFSLAVSKSVETLNHYSALLMELRATQHLKFVKSLLWLGLIFLSTCCPLGLFIVFGPVFLTLEDVESEDVGRGNTTNIKAAFGDKGNGTHNATTQFIMDNRIFFDQRLSVLDYNYLLISRSNTETLLWSLYYSFSLYIVPLLLTTEILFLREWKGHMNKMSKFLFCWKTSIPQWTHFMTMDKSSQDGYLIGPYIAKCQASAGTVRLHQAQKQAKSITIFDARKLERLGRDVGKRGDENCSCNRKQTASSVNVRAAMSKQTASSVNVRAAMSGTSAADEMNHLSLLVQGSHKQ